MNCVYMEVSKDEYELPIAIADTLSELSAITGETKNNINSSICHGNSKKGKGKNSYSRFVKVVFDD